MKDHRSFHYLDVIHLCFLWKDGSYINAVEARSQHAEHKNVEDEADEVYAALLFAGPICNFLLDPFLFQICLQTQEQEFFKTQLVSTQCKQRYIYNKKYILKSVNKTLNISWYSTKSTKRISEDGSDRLTLSSYNKLLLFSLAAFSLVMQKSQPAKILLQKLWKRSSSWTRLRLNPVADLESKSQKLICSDINV